MGIEVLPSEAQVGAFLKLHLALGSCPKWEGLFEILRSAVWSTSAPLGKAHVNRILSVALLPWRVLSASRTTSDEALRTEVLGALATLEDAGDLVALSGGYWAPAAARFVGLPDGSGHLLIGGVPSALLRLDTDVLEYHGPHRHFATIPGTLASALPREDFTSWARLPELSLQEWSRELFDSLARVPYAPTSADIFEFYLPASAKPGSPQFFRWSETAEGLTGTLLSRRRRLYGAREYRLVDVRAGTITGARELDDVDVRRLMYALDLAAGNPVRVRPLRAGGRTEWLFTSEIPRAEQRTFAALGALRLSDERRFERRWTFTRNEDLALDMLRALGIVLGQPHQQDSR